MTALTQFHYFSPYCDVTGNLGVQTAHSPVKCKMSGLIGNNSILLFALYSVNV